MSGIQAQQEISETLELDRSRIWGIRAFNSHLNYMAERGSFVEILSMIDDVQNGIIHVREPLNTYTFTILLKAYGQAGNLVAARQLLDAMSSFDEDKRPSSVTYNTMLNLYIEMGDVDAARQLFDQMESNQVCNIRPDCITYTTMLKGYTDNGDMKAANDLFQCIRKHPDPECRPTKFTYNTMMQGFIYAGDVNIAEHLLAEMVQDADIRPDVISFNTIISGFIQKGNLQRAKDLFDQMPTQGITPNEFTFQILIEESLLNNDLDYAEKLFHDVTKIDPPMTLATGVYRMLIETWLRLGNLPKAEMIFNHWILITDPESQLDDRVLMLMAAAYSQNCMVDKMLAVASRITNRDDPLMAYFEPQPAEKAPEFPVNNTQRRSSQ